MLGTKTPLLSKDHAREGREDGSTPQLLTFSRTQSSQSLVSARSPEVSPSSWKRGRPRRQRLGAWVWATAIIFLVSTVGGIALLRVNNVFGDPQREVLPQIQTPHKTATASTVKASTTTQPPLPRVPTWLTEVVTGAEDLKNRSMGNLKTLVSDLLDVATKESGAKLPVGSEGSVVDLTDALGMSFDMSCSAEEGLEADTTAPASDCGLLQEEFGLCDAFLRADPVKGANGDTARSPNPKRTFHGLPLLHSPYAQGYVTVPGLEDPVVVAAAMVDEFRRTSTSGPVRWPLAGTYATVDGAGADGRMASDASAGVRPVTIDVVYTEVDFGEPTFQADRFLYKTRPEAASASGPPPSVLRPRQLDKTRERAVANVQAPTVLPYVWRSIVNGTMGSVLGRMGASGAPEEELGAGVFAGLTDRLDQTLAAMRNQTRRSADLTRALHAYTFNAADSTNRFRNFNELRYSLRSLHRYMIRPMEAALARGASSGHGGTRVRAAFGKIYIIVSHRSQAPPWMRAHPRIVLVEHRELFPNPSRSLPTFDSLTIETVMHRIKGLSRHYLYLNNDFMFTREVSWFDFFQPFVAWSEDGASKPSVKWMPNIRLCEVFDVSSDKLRQDQNRYMPLATAEKRASRIVGSMVHDTNLLPFTVTFGHMPQLIDKLQVLRMMAEPSIREMLCVSRSRRQRSGLDMVTVYTYHHFSLLWRHGWGPGVMDRAAKELRFGPDSLQSTPSFRDSLGRQRATLWEFVAAIAEARGRGGEDAKLVIPGKGTTVFPAADQGYTEHHDRVAEVLLPIIRAVASVVGGKQSTAHVELPTTDLLDVALGGDLSKESAWRAETLSLADKKVAPTIYPDRFDHWLIDAYRNMHEPIVRLKGSVTQMFAKSTDPRTMEWLMDRIRREKEGGMLVMVQSDDLPPGSRDPSPTGIFSSLPRMAVDAVCGWGRDRLKAAIASNQMHIERSPVVDGTSVQLSLRHAARGVEHRFAGADAVEHVMDTLFNRHFPSTTGTVEPSPHADQALAQHIADRIIVACAVDDAATAVTALGAALGLADDSEASVGLLGVSDELAGLGMASPECALGTRFGDAAVERHRREGVRRFIHHYPVHARLATPRVRHPRQPRHNCTTFPIPLNEIPPATDAYVADLMIESLRLTVGDCDTAENGTSHDIPQWEIAGC